MAAAEHLAPQYPDRFTKTTALLTMATMALSGCFAEKDTPTTSTPEHTATTISGTFTAVPHTSAWQRHPEHPGVRWTCWGDEKVKLRTSTPQGPQATVENDPLGCSAKASHAVPWHQQPDGSHQACFDTTYTVRLQPRPGEDPVAIVTRESCTSE